jgi:hypothetical protein
LVLHLGISEPLATGTFFKLVQISADILDYVLDEDGIVQLPDMDFSDLESNTSETLATEEPVQEISTVTFASSEHRSNTTRRLHSGVTPSSTEDALSLSTENDTGQFEILSEESEFTYERRPSRTSPAVDRPASEPTPQFRRENARPVTYDAPYVRLLDKVIEAARSETLLNLQGLADALPSAEGNLLLGSPFGIRSQNQIAHDIKIGAAGELYVSLYKTPRLPVRSRLIVIDAFLSTPTDKCHACRLSSCFFCWLFLDLAVQTGGATFERKSASIPTIMTSLRGAAPKQQTLSTPTQTRY